MTEIKLVLPKNENPDSASEEILAGFSEQLLSDDKGEGAAQPTKPIATSKPNTAQPKDNVKPAEKPEKKEDNPGGKPSDEDAEVEDDPDGFGKGVDNLEDKGDGEGKKEDNADGDDNGFGFTSLDDALNNESPEEKEKKTEDEKKLKELTEKAEKYESLSQLVENDPFMAAYIQFKESGKTSIKDFMSQLVGPDLSLMTEEQLFAYAAKELEGIEDETEIEQYVADRMKMSDTIRKREIGKINAASEMMRSEQVKKLGLDLRSQEQIKREHKAVGQQHLKSITEKLTGKKIFGMTVTPEIADKVKNAVITDFAYYDPREGFRVNDSWEYNFFKLFKGEIFKTMQSVVAHKAKHEVLEEVVKPSASTVPSNSISSGTLTERQEIKKSTDEYLDAQYNHSY